MEYSTKRQYMRQTEWQSIEVSLEAMASLLPRQAMAVELARSGLKQTEIAGLLGVTQPSVAKLLSRASARLDSAQ